MNVTETSESPDGNYLSTQMMFVMGSVITTFTTVLLNLGRATLDYFFSIIFFEVLIDEDRSDSIESVVAERIFQHILNNKSRLQGWKVRITRNNPILESKDIKNHSFVISDGGCFFWIGRHLYYAHYDSGGNGYWATSKLKIDGIRFSRSKLVNLINSLVTKPDKLVKNQWTNGKDDNQMWQSGKGRNKYIEQSVYITTTDGDRVLAEIERCVNGWEKKDNPFVRQSTGGCFLLHGPHGTGKTKLINYVAFKYKMPVCVITQDELHTSTFSKMMETLDPGSIVLFDDIDLSLFTDKETDEEEQPVMARRTRRGRGTWGRGMKAVIKSVMDGTNNLPERCLYFMCCNDTELDLDIKSRFTPFYMGYADDKWRKALFGHVFPEASSELREQFSGLYSDAPCLDTASSIHVGVSQRDITRELARHHSSSPEETIQSISREREKEEEEVVEEEVVEEEVEVFHDWCWM